MDFDVVPYEDIVWGKKLGAGSFGSVYRGTYLGIDIAIKEVLPSTEYDVHKYFEREWRIMRECRHPNIVLFLGLSKAPEGDGRVFIISEFVPGGNLRHFLLSSHPFPWRLRISFATDVARAVAYLHARQCIHRDLKGENLLIASNDRIKVTDFGFARIASRNAEEMKRMTFCGTDGYMSPEIINGFDFDLPTDVFSLGIIFIEILCRRLVDSKTFVRAAPHFVPDPEEVRRRASRNCPSALIDLALECCREEPFARPKMPEVLHRLREIEKDVLTRLPEEDAEHVGSIRLVRHGGKRAMPIFDSPPHPKQEEKEDEMEENDRKMEEEALVALAHLKVDGSGPTDVVEAVKHGAEVQETRRTARWEDGSGLSGYTEASELDGHVGNAGVTSSFFSGIPSSITAATSHLSSQAIASPAGTPRMDSTASTITLRGALTDDPSPQDIPPRHLTPSPRPPPEADDDVSTPKAQTTAIMPKAAPSPRLMTKMEKTAEEDAKPDPPLQLGTHRFTLVDKDALNLLGGKKASAFPSSFAAFLPKALTASSKCPVCARRLNTRPALQCDDCSIFVHVKCSHAAARDCHGGEV